MIGCSRRPGAWSLWPVAIPVDCACKWAWYRRKVDGTLLFAGCPRHTHTGVEQRVRATRYTVANVPRGTGT